MADETYRGLLENISETSGTYKQMLQAIAAGGGGGGGVLVANMDAATGALDKTWQEIYDAMNSSVLCVSRSQTKIDAEGFTSIAFNVIQDAVIQEGSYSLHLSDGTPFIASTANDYPVMND